MSGRAESVEVRVAASGQMCVPEMFVWRERLYVIREVHGRRRARVDWWRRLADRSGAASSTVGLREETVWRVSASAGRELGTREYEIACAPDEFDPSACWSLRPVAA